MSTIIDAIKLRIFSTPIDATAPPSELSSKPASKSSALLTTKTSANKAPKIQAKYHS